MSTLIYDITLNCNLKCKHCYNSKVLTPSMELDIDIEKTMKKILEIDPDVIIIQGGEPLLVKNIDILIKEIKKIKKRVYITTNAILLDSEKSIKLLKNGLSGIFFSIESLNKEKNEKIRGKGSYEKAIQNILEFMKIYKLAISRKIINEILLCISVTITPFNINGKKDIEEIFEFAYKNSINDLAFAFLVNSGEGEVLLQLDKRSNISVAEDIGEIGNQYPNIRVRIAYKKIMIDYLRKKYKNLNIWGEKKGCVAGNELLYLNDKLDIFPCVYVNKFGSSNYIVREYCIEKSEKYTKALLNNFITLKNEIQKNIPKLCQLCEYREECIQVCPYDYKILGEKINTLECIELKKLIKESETSRGDENDRILNTSIN